VNLVNQVGHEKPIKLAFEELVCKIGMAKVKYVYFDFHHECSKMRWDRISVLIDSLKEDLAKQQYQTLYLANVDIPQSKKISLSTNKSLLYGRIAWIV
jgi:phosphatidylinositol 4-phosphatase